MIRTCETLRAVSPSPALHGIYAVCTEGFDTSDLREAAALIRDLSGHDTKRQKR